MNFPRPVRVCECGTPYLFSLFTHDGARPKHACPDCYAVGVGAGLCVGVRGRPRSPYISQAVERRRAQYRASKRRAKMKVAA